MSAGRRKRVLRKERHVFTVTRDRDTKWQQPQLYSSIFSFSPFQSSSSLTPHAATAAVGNGHLAASTANGSLQKPPSRSSGPSSRLHRSRTPDGEAGGDRSSSSATGLPKKRPFKATMLRGERGISFEFGKFVAQISISGKFFLLLFLSTFSPCHFPPSCVRTFLIINRPMMKWGKNRRSFHF